MTAQPRPSSDSPPSASTGLLILSWLVVGIPLALGVYLTILKSLPLFR
jgi:hypothetical protein